MFLHLPEIVQIAIELRGKDGEGTKKALKYATTQAQETCNAAHSGCTALLSQV